MSSELVTVRDVARAWPVVALAGLLDGDAAVPDSLPPLTHWLHFLPPVGQAEIGADGHPLLSGELARFVGYRRMWASARVTFNAPIPIGADLSRRSRIKDIQEKNGRSGPLTFVTHSHEIAQGNRVLLCEEQHIVYRKPAAEMQPAVRGATAPEGDWQRKVVPDETTLMRFSALTYNAHRIHYDRDYACEAEGYPDLVVQGPLTAILLMDLFRRAHPQRLPRSFSFVARKALFVNPPVTLHGALVEGGAELLAANEMGEIAMSAQIEA